MNEAVEIIQANAPSTEAVVAKLAAIGAQDIDLAQVAAATLKWATMATTGRQAFSRSPAPEM